MTKFQYCVACKKYLFFLDFFIFKFFQNFLHLKTSKLNLKYSFVLSHLLDIHLKKNLESTHFTKRISSAHKNEVSSLLHSRLLGRACLCDISVVQSDNKSIDIEKNIR